MGRKKEIKFHNKSDRPDNVVLKELEINAQSEEIEQRLPPFMRNFFVYLRSNVLAKTRLAYLTDIEFFCSYLISESFLAKEGATRDISIETFNKIKAMDVNMFIDYCRSYQKTVNGELIHFENSNRTLARKKSSLSVLFKQLYRDELLDKNITDGFNPIRVQSPGEHEIKALQDDEVMIMLDAVTTGNGLTNKEAQYWEKTKKRDKAILVIFLTYGLRLSELQQLNVSSFNFSRGEFIIYRKRGKESTMPINRSVLSVLSDYIENERKINYKQKDENEDALFLSLQGNRMTERQIRTLVKKYTSIGMNTSRNSGYSPHKLRATAATSLIGRGNSIYDVAALLDHEQVTTTQLYAAHKLNVKRDLVSGMEWEVERKETGVHSNVENKADLKSKI